MYSNLLKNTNEIFKSCDAILVQPIYFKRENINQQFQSIHRVNILNNCINFIELNEREKFKNYLLGNKLSAPPLFITKVKFFKKFCEQIFPLLEKSYNYFKQKDLCHGYNIRLPACFIERYASYWFEKNCNTKYLSHARIGSFMLSNKLNKYIKNYESLLR